MWLNAVDHTNPFAPTSICELFKFSFWDWTTVNLYSETYGHLPNY